MNILIINGSPRKKGLISQMLGIMREKAEKRGDIVEMVYTNDLTVKPCTGCMACRTKEKCVLAEDDSQRVLKMMQEADVIIMGAPCYWGNIPGQMKLMFDRQVYGMMRDTDRFPEPLMKGKKCILVSTCTTPWPWNILFKQSRGAIRAMREIARYAGFKIVSTIERGGTAMHPELTEKDKQKCRKAIVSLRFAALIAAMMMSMMTFAQLNDSISADTTMWFNQTQELSGVVVKGRLPKTRVKGDAMRTKVAGTILEKAGTVSDALSKIPSLKAERDGGVEVLGRGAAEVYINGRKVQDMKELSRLRSDQIQHVDVVQNPGARYAASTKAVVRITLKKAQGEGLSFQNSTQFMYQYGGSLNDNFTANYRTGGLDVTGSFWVGTYNHAKSLQVNDMLYYVGQDQVTGYSTQEIRSPWHAWSPQLQLNYMVNDNHTFGAYYKYDRTPSYETKGDYLTDMFENGILTERSASYIWQDQSTKKHIFNAYYNGKVGQLGIDLNIDGLFDDTKTPGRTTEQTIDHSSNAQPMVNGQSSMVNRIIESNTNSSNNFWASKLIFSYPILKGNLSVGGEYSYNHRTDAYTFMASDYVPVKATDTEINEKSAAAFIEYGRQFGKVYAQAGLRYEHLTNDYFNFGVREDEVCRDYGDWFPTATLSAPIGKLQLSLSYRRDIQRPAYSSLTSSTMYVNRYTYQSGNPYLKPTYNHSIVLNAAYHWANLTVEYGRMKDSETMSTEPFPGSTDPLISLVRPINSEEDYNQLSLSLSARPTINFRLSTFNCSWHPMWYAFTVFQNYKTPTADGTIKTLNDPYFTLIWNNDIELHRSFRLTANAQWATKGDYNNFSITAQRFDLTLGVQRDFNLRRLGQLTLDVRCVDVLNTNKTEAVIYGIRELATANPARRTFLVNLNWKFNEARSKYRGSGAGEKQKARM